MIQVLIGLVVPVIAVVFFLPWANSVDVTLLGVPFVFLWLFSWFVLTSVCLMTCWLVFDRHRADP